MELDISAICVSGLVRESNEDMAAVGSALIRDGEFSMRKTVGADDWFFLLVSDGMGGHEKGGYASEYTLDSVRKAVEKGVLSSPPDFPDWMNALAGAELDRMSVEKGLSRGMGCTLTGVFWTAGRIWLVNAGDSRTYRLRDGILRMLTRDQNLHELYGTPVPEGKRLYNCIGGGTGSSFAAVDDMSGRLLGGDRLLICSDGLTDMVSDDEMEAVLASGLSAAEAAAALAEAAEKNGGADNISVVIADIDIK